ncbi:MAG: hypothetical protein QME96_13850, partial [Myxococcota bacterium]|nr:hypothetical protein [Myxococcota bacterium]
GAEWVLWLLLALSVISIAVMVERGILLYRRRGDRTLPRLAGEEPLHFANHVTREITVRGEAEYQRILAIYHKQRSAGAAEYQQRRERFAQIQTQAAAAGQRAFANMPEYERWRIWVGSTKREWLFNKARADLRERDREYFPDLGVIDDPARRGAWILQIGCKGVGPDAEAILAQVTSGVIQSSDPMAQRILDRCRSIGSGAVSQAERALFRRMNQRDPGTQRPSEFDAPGAQSRERTKAAELGRSSLSAADTAFLEENAELVNASDPEPYYWTLGWNLLSDRERRELGSKAYSAFVSEHHGFVDREGRRLYREFLVETFHGCEYKVDEVKLRGPFSRGMLRTWQARVKLKWIESPEPRPATCEGYLGRKFTLRYERGKWHMVWGAVPPFDADPGTDDEEED